MGSLWAQLLFVARKLESDHFVCFCSRSTGAMSCEICASQVNYPTKTRRCLQMFARKQERVTSRRVCGAGRAWATRDTEQFNQRQRLNLHLSSRIFFNQLLIKFNPNANSVAKTVENQRKRRGSSQLSTPPANASSRQPCDV